MIFHSVKLEKVRNILKVKNERTNDSDNDLNLLLSYQRRVRERVKIDEPILPKMNCFNPQTKEQLKKNLIRFLANNKTLKHKVYAKPPSPKKDMKKFYIDYQGDILKKRIERVKRLNELFINKRKDHSQDSITKSNQTCRNSNKEYITLNHNNSCKTIMESKSVISRNKGFGFRKYSSSYILELMKKY